MAVTTTISPGPRSTELDGLCKAIESHPIWTELMGPVPTGTNPAEPTAVTSITHATAPAGSSTYTTTGTSAYGYNADGQTTAAPVASYTWTPSGQLASIKNTATGQTQNRIYDASGNLLVQTDPVNGTIAYVGDSELKVPANSTTVTGERRYGAHGRTVAVRVGSSSLNFLSGDIRGTSTIAYSYTNGAIELRYYDPFGNQRGGSGTWPVADRGYLGAPTDAFSSLTHLGARDYNPGLGRFLSVDPVFSPNDPQQANGYSYANNNPTTESDPSGLRPDCPSRECDSKGNDHGSPVFNEPSSVVTVGQALAQVNQDANQAALNYLLTASFASPQQREQLLQMADYYGTIRDQLEQQVAAAEAKAEAAAAAQRAAHHHSCRWDCWTAVAAITVIGLVGTVVTAGASDELAATADAAILADTGVTAAVDATADATAAEAVPTLEIDAARMPNIARNVQSALDEGHPGLLQRTTDDALIRSNRSTACAGFCGPGSPDEYPFASTLQGGAGARVAGVPLAEQRIQGGVMSSFYQKFGLQEGDWFRVMVSGLEP